MKAICMTLLAGFALTGCLGHDTPLEDRPGYDRAHYRAGLECTFSPPAPANAGPGYLDTDEYARCVQRATEAYLDGR